jgi:5-formyltetrahydrofolate cyclo-ligase
MNTMPSPPADPLAAAKAELRRTMKERRDALPADARAAAAEAIAARPLPVAVSGLIVSGFFPFRTEINPLPLMRRFVAEGASLALPVIAGRGHPLTMRAYAFGDPLVAATWGIREPGPDAPEVAPDVVIVPLLAFDRAGRRIGYGAGYFDMTLTRLRTMKPVTAIGIAFAAQEVPEVPTSDRDARLDLVLTEREVIDFRA